MLVPGSSLPSVLLGEHLPSTMSVHHAVSALDEPWMNPLELVNQVNLSFGRGTSFCPSYGKGINLFFSSGMSEAGIERSQKMGCARGSSVTPGSSSRIMCMHPLAAVTNDQT